MHRFDDPHSQARINDTAWRDAGLVRRYANRRLRPVEADLLLRHRDTLAGRVLELGCGAGRLTGYLTVLGGRVHGIDLSPEMVAHCRRMAPEAAVEVGDLRDLSRFAGGAFDAVVAGFNVVDVLDDAERRTLLAELGRLIAPGGLLLMSSHNRAFAPRVRRPTQVRLESPRALVHDLVRMPRSLRNHRRLQPLERDAPDYAVINDSAHDFALLHYYVTPDTQERQLAAAGFDLLECLDLEGRPAAASGGAADCPELHYAARRRR